MDWPDAPRARWLLYLPGDEALPVEVILTELARRLCDVLCAAGASVLVDYGGGEEELATYGKPDGAETITVALPLFATRKGRLCVHTRPSRAGVSVECRSRRPRGCRSSRTAR